VRPGDDAALEVAADEVARGQLSGIRVFAAGNMALDDPRQRPAIELAQRARVPVLIMTLPNELANLTPLVKEFADVDFVLDHCGFIEITRPDWSDVDILAPLIACPNVSLKVSSIVLTRARAVGDPAQLVRVLADRVGSSRLMWGSDFPHSYDGGYAALVELGRHAARALGAAEAVDYLSGTATRLWP
jgi:L-fuconolactonase